MPQCDLVAVAEKFGDQRREDLGDEILESGVPGAKQVDAQFAQSHHDRPGVEMLAGIKAREQPGRSDAAAVRRLGGSCRWCPSMPCERFWNRNRFNPKGNFPLNPRPVMFSH